MNFTIPESVIQWFLGTFGVGTIALIWGIIQTPRQIKALRKALEEQNKLFRTRVFPRLRRLEQYLIETHLQSGKPLDGLLKEIRENQYDAADERDKELDKD